MGIGYRRHRFRIVMFKANVKTGLEVAFSQTLNFNQTGVKFTTINLQYSKTWMHVFLKGVDMQYQDIVYKMQIDDFTTPSWFKAGTFCQTYLTTSPVNEITN